MTRVPIITGTLKALDWECGLTITRKAASLRCAGDQPRVAARRAQPGRSWDRPTGDLGARSFPASPLPSPCGPTTLPMVTCSPHCRHPTSSWVAYRGHTPVCHRASDGRRSWDDRGKGVPPIFPRRWGAPSLRLEQVHPHPHCRMALQAAGQQSRVHAWAHARTHPCTERERERYPVRTGQLINSFSLSVVLHPRGLPGYSSSPPPERRTDGAGFIHQSTNPGCGPHANQGRAGQGCLGARAPVGTLRAGPGLGWLAVGRVDALRSRARALKLSLGPHVAMAILVMGCSKCWVATQTTESRR